MILRSIVYFCDGFQGSPCQSFYELHGCVINSTKYVDHTSAFLFIVEGERHASYFATHILSLH